MDTREMLEKNTVCGPRGRKKLLYCKSITRICLFMLMLIVISSCGGGVSYYHYHEDSQGHHVDDEAAFHYNQGNDYQKNGDYANAISEYTMALEIQPHTDAYYGRGFCYLAIGQYDQTIADANKAIALDPKYAYVYFLKAAAYEAMKRNKEAIEAYRVFLTYAPSHYEARNWMEKAKERIAELEKQR